MSIARYLRYKTGACGLVAAIMAVPLTGHACGLDYGNEVQESKAVHYIGFVKDQKGGAVPDATILVTTGKEFVSDARGKFSGSLGYDTDNAGVVFVCKKSGFRNALGVKRPSTVNPLAIFVMCAMRPEQ